MAEGRWLLYGANGYTGELIAEEARARGMRPVLAGRRAELVAPIARRLGFEHRIFPLDDPRQIARELEGFDTVLLAAGPFARTSAPVVDACLQARAHYLDITGEIEVFEACWERHERALAAGCVILPGVGFDVVPSDCLAASLRERVPDADRLELAFAVESGPSRGTARTMVERAWKGGAIREGGQIVRVPMPWRTIEVPFRDRRRLATTYPWGDVSSAYRSTGIPNIAAYAAVDRRDLARLRRARRLLPLLKLGPVRRLASALAGRGAKGPSAATRAEARGHLWGRVTNAGGRAVEGTLETPEGYRLTALTAVEAVRRVLAGGVAPGALTPAMAFGADFITAIEGCDLRVGESGAGPAAARVPEARPGASVS